MLPFNGHVKITTQQRTSITVIGTLAVDGWVVTFGTARRGLGGGPVYQLNIKSNLFVLAACIVRLQSLDD